MISTRTGRQKLFDGFVICFLAAACAATIALNTGLCISPGKVLPVSISMRSGDMSENIILGIKNAERDVAAIRAGMSPAEAWTTISDRNMDLFFLIALILPGNLTSAILTIGYFLRFGAAAALMYWFCCRHAGLRRLYSFLLGMMYALSAQVVLTAQFAPVMNMVLLLPAALSSFDSYLRERTWKSFALSCIACALTAVSGVYGCLSGLPFLAVSGLVLSVGLYSRKRKVLSSWFKIMGAVIAGTAMASFSVIPRFFVMIPKFNVVEAAQTAEVRYKLFDLLRHTYVAQSGGIDMDSVPVFYIGILTLEALVLFWANFKIPVRVKVTAAVILSVWYISCASSFVSEAVSIFGENSTLSASRLICLEVFLFFYAAIALRNIKGVTSGALYAAFLVPMAFLVFSGNYYSDIQFSTTINLGTGVVMLICGLVIRRLTLKPAGTTVKIFVAGIGALAVALNAAFIMFNNTLNLSDPGADMTPYVSDEEDEEDEDYYEPEDEAGFSVFASHPGFLLLSEDISSYRPESFTDAFNHMSEKALAGKCFEEYSLIPVYSDQAEHTKNDLYSVGTGFSSITFKLTCGKADRLFVYSGFDGEITLRNTREDFEEERDFSGPFLTELDASEGEHELAVFFGLDEQSENRLAVMRLNRSAKENLERSTHAISNNEFSFRLKELPDADYGMKSFITSVPYSPSVRITLNGKDIRTFEYMGLTGGVFEASENVAEYKVQISMIVPGLSGGITVSVAVCLAIIAIPLIYKYTYKNNKKGKGSEGDELTGLPDGNVEQEDS